MDGPCLACPGLEPQLSPGVTQQIKLEEQAGRKGDLRSRRQLTGKIDSMIRRECQAALKYIVDLHAKQRSKCWQDQRKERDRVARQLDRFARQAGLQFQEDGSVTLLPSRSASPTSSTGPRSRAGRGSPSSPASNRSRALSERTDAREHHELVEEEAKAMGNADGTPSTPSRADPPEPTTPGAAAALGRVRQAGRGEGAPVTFEEAERQCRRDDSEVWASSEKLALASAFRTNVRRIEVEWGEYKRKLRQEYAAAYKRHSKGPMPPEVAAAEAEEAVRRKAAEQEKKSNGAAAGGASSGEGEGEGKQWLSKEKQEQLIHTAPVLQPSLGPEGSSTLDITAPASPTGSADPGASGECTDGALSVEAAGALERGNVEAAAARAAQDARAAAEASTSKLPSKTRQVLRQLAGRYASAVAQIDVQQEEATRWVLRQCRRMLMQVDAQEMERVQVRNHEEQEEKEWRRLLALARRCQLTLAPESTTPDSSPRSPFMAGLDGRGAGSFGRGSTVSSIASQQTADKAAAARGASQSAPQAQSQSQSQGQSRRGLPARSNSMRGGWSLGGGPGSSAGGSQLPETRTRRTGSMSSPLRRQRGGEPSTPTGTSGGSSGRRSGGTSPLGPRSEEGDLSRYGGVAGTSRLGGSRVASLAAHGQEGRSRSHSAAGQPPPSGAGQGGSGGRARSGTDGSPLASGSPGGGAGFAPGQRVGQSGNTWGTARSPLERRGSSKRGRLGSAAQDMLKRGSSSSVVGGS